MNKMDNECAFTYVPDDDFGSSSIIELLWPISDVFGTRALDT